MDANAPLHISPAMLNLLRSVPAAEVEAAMKKAFPQFFRAANEVEPRSAGKRLLDQIRQNAIDMQPGWDVDGYIREMRDKDRLDG